MTKDTRIASPRDGFTASFESLGSFVCPDWFRDAKFGIWSHWGPQSVPMFGDWYARNMYIQDTEQYLYHLRHYGHPSKFGYKDICSLWKAENFDPEGLMALYYKAGARYFVAQAMHHDHFFNYASRINRMNSVNVGPGKDVCGLWKAAAKKYGMPFGLTEHLGASFSWWRVNKMCDTHGPYAGVPYDGNDPDWRDFYFDNYQHVDGTTQCDPWYTDDERFRSYWLDVMKEIIDLYQPDLLYSDGALPFGDRTARPDYEKGLEAVAYLYNASIREHGENRAVYTQKERRPEVYRVGVLDIEKSQLSGVSPEPWQTDTCIGNWFYDARAPFKRPEHIVEMLVDIISKNGTMLLNVLQRPDGAIDDETRYILDSLADWFAICGTGVYGTRPYRVFGEGPTRVLIQGFTEKRTDWTEYDIRFTKKDATVYAFLLGRPRDNTAVIRSVAEPVRGVRLLGYGNVEYESRFGALTVALPERLPAACANCLAIDVES